MATRPDRLAQMAADIRAMAARAENEDIREQLLELAADLEGAIGRIRRGPSLQDLGANAGALASARAED